VPSKFHAKLMKGTEVIMLLLQLYFLFSTNLAKFYFCFSVQMRLYSTKLLYHLCTCVAQVPSKFHAKLIKGTEVITYLLPCRKSQSSTFHNIRERLANVYCPMSTVSTGHVTFFFSTFNRAIAIKLTELMYLVCANIP
jgi:hypothetical protein